MKSSLSSPITAIRAPVASLRISLSLSVMVAIPPGVEKRPRPSDTRPEALIRKRCPFLTTRPLFVQPLLDPSARTPTLIVKKVGADDEFVGDESMRGSDAAGSGSFLRLFRGAGLLRAILLSSLTPDGPDVESNSIDSTSST